MTGLPRRPFSHLFLVKGWYQGIIPKNEVLLPLGLLFPKAQSHSALFMLDKVLQPFLVYQLRAERCMHEKGKLQNNKALCQVLIYMKPNHCVNSVDSVI